MRRMKFILEKEFKQIFRDKTILALMFLMPVIQLGILPFAMNFDVKHINLAIVDNDHSPFSQQLISKIGSSGYFNILSAPNDYKSGLDLIYHGSADALLEIPPYFERDLIRNGRQQLHLAVDAINGTKSNLGSAYLMAVVQDFNQQIILRINNGMVARPSAINVTNSIWYNVHAEYQLYIVPGILVLLLTLVGGFFSSLNIVREKEVGTIEQINVSPIKKWQFILGKLIPFWVVGMIVLTVGLVVARVVYGIIPQGNILIIYLLAAIYLVALLGFGLFISTISNNQLQSMFIAFFFIMIFVLMSGLFTSVESMPGWARAISEALHITHFMRAIRMVVLKGSGLQDVLPQLYRLIGFSVFLNALAIWNYRKTS